MPADWEAGSEGLTELRRCLGEDHGDWRSGWPDPLRSPLAHSCGLWNRAELRLARRDLTPPIEATLFSLAWLELEGVS